MARRGPSPYQRAENESRRMHLFRQRNEHCLLTDGHEPHVFRAGSRDNPCGGRGERVDKDTDRRIWDRPGGRQ